MERCVGGSGPVPGHDDRRVERFDGHAVQLDPRPPRARGRPPQHRRSSPVTRSAMTTRDPQRVLDGGVGGRHEHEPGDDRHGIVKSIGPDVDKLLSTLAYLGPGYRFLISGYPPFLKHLLDEGGRRGFPWRDYELHGLVGGEGMTEELRDVLLEGFRSVFSGYGATDIEIGMAASRPSASPIRRLARSRARCARGTLRAGLAPADGVPVQPADPLPRGQRGRRDHLHRLETGPARATDPLQRPR